jgi:hypothetical protein
MYMLSSTKSVGCLGGYLGWVPILGEAWNRFIFWVTRSSRLAEF